MALSVLKDIRKIYAGLNSHEIRASAGREITVGLMASSEAAFRRMEDFLAPPSSGGLAPAQALRAVRSVSGSPRQFDFVLCEPGQPVPANGYLFDPGHEASLIPHLVSDRQELELALARTLPLFRPVVVNRMIGRVARENALFCVVTGLPNIVPNLLELPWTVGEFVTDTAFLTMNQIRLALMLAAVYGHPVGYMEQKAELVGIVAGAFGWRALARELVGKIPLGGGLIPKAAVAFAGTYVVGLSLDKFNRTGLRLSRQERRDAYADAFVKGKETVAVLTPHLHEKPGDPARH
jgi:hypothetical protein